MPPKITLSRGLEDRIKLAEILREVFGAISPELARLRAEVLAPELRAGEEMPDAELEHELYLRLLDRRLKDAIETEQGYRRAAIRHKALSRDLGQTTAELSSQLGGLRQVVDLAMGKGTSKQLLDFKGRTQRRQLGVYSQAGATLVRLDELEPVEPISAGVSGDPEVWKGMIEPEYGRLAHLRQLVQRQQKVLDALLIDKEKAFALFDVTARSLVRIAEGQCQLVGREDLAKRIRQFSRKRRRPGPKPKKKAKKGKKAKRKQAKQAARAVKKRSAASAKVA